MSAVEILNNDVSNEENCLKDDSTNDNDYSEFVKIVSDCDASGIPWAWYEVRKKMCEKGVGSLNDVLNTMRNIISFLILGLTIY